MDADMLRMKSCSRTGRRTAHGREVHRDQARLIGGSRDA